jgi:hypothetical protein
MTASGSPTSRKRPARWSTSLAAAAAVVGGLSASSAFAGPTPEQVSADVFCSQLSSSFQVPGYSFSGWRCEPYRVSYGVPYYHVWVVRHHHGVSERFLLVVANDGEVVSHKFLGSP